MPDSLFSSRPEGTGRKNGGESLCSPPRGRSKRTCCPKGTGRIPRPRCQPLYIRPASSRRYGLPVWLSWGGLFMSRRLFRLPRIQRASPRLSGAPHACAPIAPIRFLPDGRVRAGECARPAFIPLRILIPGFSQLEIDRRGPRSQNATVGCLGSSGAPGAAARPRRRGDQRPTESLWAAVTDHVLGDP